MAAVALPQCREVQNTGCSAIANKTRAENFAAVKRLFAAAPDFTPRDIHRGQKSDEDCEQRDPLKGVLRRRPEFRQIAHEEIAAAAHRLLRHATKEPADFDPMNRPKASRAYK